MSNQSHDPVKTVEKISHLLHADCSLQLKTLVLELCLMIKTAKVSVLKLLTQVKAKDTIKVTRISLGKNT